MDGSPLIDSPATLARELEQRGYFADQGLATVAFLAYRMRRPLFLEGDPGVGKTDFARALAEVTRSTPLRLQCYEGIDRRQALYDWDFTRQLLHLRSADSHDAGTARNILYSDTFLLRRPILDALAGNATLLIDEIDRADDEFEAFLLEVLSTHTVTIPEFGTVAAPDGREPWVVITSNRTREVHDALKRRCFYHWVNHPSLDQEIRIVSDRVPEASAALIRDVAVVAARLRAAGLQKAPGVAETVDWVRALHLLGSERLDTASAKATVGVVIKVSEDVDAVVHGGLLTP